MRLPTPMLVRSGPLNRRAHYACEVKWDGFRALCRMLMGQRGQAKAILGVLVHGP